MGFVSLSFLFIPFFVFFFLYEYQILIRNKQANVWYSNYIVVIDPESETVSHRIDLKSLKKENPGGVLNGIAYDSKNNKLYVTGKNWANIYQIEIDPPIPNYAPPPSPSPSFPPSPSPISSASCLGLLPIVFVFIQALHLLFM